MRKTNMIYLVQSKVGKKYVSSTLREWCTVNEISYNTVLARIWRSNPKTKGGVIYFKEDDEILKKPPQGKGAPKLGATPPCRKFKVQRTKHDTILEGKDNSGGTEENAE